MVDAIWFNQGQVCCAGSRLLVQENVADRLITKLRTRMEKLRIGDPLDKAIDMGAIVSPGQLNEIQRLVTQGIEEGATMWQPSWACPTDGYFFPPTLFTNVSPAAAIAQVEIFGLSRPDNLTKFSASWPRVLKRVRPCGSPRGPVPRKATSSRLHFLPMFRQLPPLPRSKSLGPYWSP